MDCGRGGRARNEKAVRVTIGGKRKGRSFRSGGERTVEVG